MFFEIITAEQPILWKICTIAQIELQVAFSHDWFYTVKADPLYLTGHRNVGMLSMEHFFLNINSASITNKSKPKSLSWIACNLL